MGIRLATKVLSPYWGERLNSTDRVIAATMAVAAFDPGKQNPDEYACQTGTYFGGVEYLARVLGGDENGKATDSSLRCVRRSLRRLEQAGMIEVVRRGFGGNRSIWRVTPDSPTMQIEPVDNSPKPVDNPVHNPVDNSKQ